MPVCLVMLSACRSTVSEQPPVHLNANMDFQERFDPQEANDFFADGRSITSTRESVRLVNRFRRPRSESRWP
jgi:hypothetical protein